MKMFKLTAAILLVTSTCTIFFFNKAALACEVAALSGFEQIQSDIFVDDSLNKAERTQLLTLIQQAKSRVDETFGKMSASPRYIVSKHAKYRSLGFNPTGMARSSLSKECVFIGPKGINVDVIAHETVHAEVFYRASFLTKYFKLKPWLLEGSGTYVDFRSPLLLENINIDNAEVAKVMGLSDFSSSDIRAYQASRVAFERVNPKKLYEGIHRLNSGESFDAVFGQ